MLSSEDAKIAILDALQQTLSSSMDEPRQMPPLAAATAMGMVIALRVGEMIGPEEFLSLSEQVIRGISRQLEPAV